jgi:multidrug efflux pump subunit AcrA (membrane-fusion protein)
MRQVFIKLKPPRKVTMLEELLKPRLPFDPDKKIVRVSLLVLVLIPFFPWVSFTVGEGQVTALDPNERIQSITTPVDGFVSAWLIGEGREVKGGETIARLQDNDPALLERFLREMEAAKAAVESGRLMLNTAKINLDRQRKLFDEGLSSRKEYEKAEIEASKIAMDFSKALAIMTKAETQYSRQLQTIVAPRDGTITRILPGERGQLIKAGTPIAVLTPDITMPSVEVWVDGNDISMLSNGQKANVQFEGWPSIQVAGWPNIAIGVFAAKVHLVDAASSYKGKFRVLLVPDGEWPKAPFLRPGAHVKAYITLAKSFVLREFWRQFTGLPPLTAPINDELNRLMHAKKEGYHSKDERDKEEK